MSARPVLERRLCVSRSVVNRLAEPPVFLGPAVLGRPSWSPCFSQRLLALADGSLLVSEDGNNTLWRVAYGGK